MVNRSLISKEANFRGNLCRQDVADYIQYIHYSAEVIRAARSVARRYDRVFLNIRLKVAVQISWELCIHRATS